MKKPYSVIRELLKDAEQWNAIGQHELEAVTLQTAVEYMAHYTHSLIPPRTQPPPVPVGFKQRNENLQSKR